MQKSQNEQKGKIEMPNVRWYRVQIIDLIETGEFDELYLKKIYKTLKAHMEKRGR